MRFAMIPLLCAVAAPLAHPLAPGRPAATGPMEFDFRDPKQISSVSLAIDSPLEPIYGYAKGLSGIIRFDPAKPLNSSGQIAVDVSSITFANEGYTATARGYALNEQKFPQLRLTVRRVVRFRRESANVFRGVVMADFTCRGITQPKRLDVTATYLPGRAEERTNGKYKGDLLVLRTQFAVSRSAHGISQGIPAEMVGDTIQVNVAVVGIHYLGKPPVSPAKGVGK